MSFLLMVFLTLVCLFEAYSPPLFGYGPPALGVALTWLAVAAVLAQAFWLVRGLRRALDGDPGLRERGLRRYERGRIRHQAGLIGAYVVALGVFGWGWAVQHYWTWPGHGLLPGAEVLLLSPFLVSQLLSWALFYDADLAVHRSAYRPPDGPPASEPQPVAEPRARHACPPFGGRLGYVAFQVRQKLALVFIPVLLLIARNEVLRLLPPTWEDRKDVIEWGGFVALPVVFVGMPWVVRLFLGLKPLPAGPLKQRLDAAAGRLRFRCSALLIWNTRSGMANAMVVGILPWLRYVVFTDRLLEDFSEDEVEAVFGHEVGHVRYNHILYYLGFLIGSMAVLGMAVNDYLPALVNGLLAHLPAGAIAAVGGEESLNGILNQSYRQFLELFTVVAVLLPYIFVVFGFLSRRCERQADIFGCRAVSCHQAGDCCGHPPDMPLPPRGQGLCPTGISTFIRALEKVALVNGISRDRPGFLHSWQHSTIARRVEFLQRMLLDPSVERHFQRRVALVKWVLFLALGGALVFLVTNHSRGPEVTPAAAAQDVQTPHGP